MFTLLDFPDVLLLAILTKLSPHSFARIFRTNKSLQCFIRDYRKNFQIKEDRGVEINLSTDGKQLIVYANNKPQLQCEIGNVQEEIMDQLCYFKFCNVYLKTSKNELVARICPLQTVQLTAYWNEEIGHIVRAIRPKRIFLNEEEEKTALYELDIDLLKDLKLESLRFDNSHSAVNLLCEHPNKVEYMLLTCAAYTNAVDIDVVSSERLRNFLKIIYKKFHAGEHGRLEYIYIDNCGEKTLNLNQVVPTCSKLENCQKEESTATELQLWMVPLDNDFILAAQYKFYHRDFDAYQGKFQFDLLLVRNFGSFSRTENVFNGNLDLQKVWDVATAQLQLQGSEHFEQFK